MSDRTLRGSEQRWAQEGTLEAEAALIRHRVREGRISEHRVTLASHYGSRAAQVLYPNWGPWVDPDDPTMRRLCALAVYGWVKDHVTPLALGLMRTLWANDDTVRAADAVAWHALASNRGRHGWAPFENLWGPLSSLSALAEIERACGLGMMGLEGPVDPHVRARLLRRSHLCPWLVGHGAPQL